MTTSDPARPAHAPPNQKAPRRLARLGLRLLVFAGVLLVVWLGAQLALRRPRPAPLWTEADLPPLPPAAENGRALVDARVRPSNSPPDTPRPLQDLLRPTGAAPADRWVRVEPLAPTITSLLKDPSVQPWLTLLDEAYARPRFADACPMSFDANCPMMQPFQAHRLQEVAALQEGLQGRWPEALARAERSLRANLDLMSSARGFVAYTMGMSNAHRSVELIHTLLDGHARAGQPTAGADLTPVASRIVSDLAGLREADLHMQRAVIGQYLHFVQSLDMVSRGTPMMGVSSTSIAARLFDPGQTLEVANEYFTRLMAAARDPRAVKPPEPYTLGAGWWLNNATGKRVLSVTLLDFSYIRDKEAEKAALLTEKESLLRRLRAMGVNAP